MLGHCLTSLHVEPTVVSVAPQVSLLPYYKQVEVLEVSGANISPMGLRCRVGTVNVSFVYVDTTKVVCDIPVLEPGNYAVSLSNDGVTYNTASNQVTVLGTLLLGGRALGLTLSSYVDVCYF